MRVRFLRNTGLARKFRIVWAFKIPSHLRNLAAMLLQGRRGGVGWLIRVERRYAPSVDQLPGLTSASNPGQYWSHDLGGDKMAFTRHGYAPVYAEVLKPWLDRPFVLVELGTFRGTSLAVWSDLFPNARLIGLDIDFTRFESNLPTLRSRGAFQRSVPDLVEFDAFEPDVARLVDALAGDRIGIFVDDGPHADQAIYTTLAAVLPLMAEDFIYVIEDNDRIAPNLRALHPELDVASRDKISILTQKSTGRRLPIG